MSINRSIPDFKLLPWARRNVFDVRSEGGVLLGEYIEYINERSSKFGASIQIYGARDQIIIWEEGVILRQVESICTYMAYRVDDGWQKIRIKDRCDPRAELEILAKERKITLYFNLAIKGEVPVTFSIKTGGA